MRNLLFAICCFTTLVCPANKSVIHADIITIENFDPVQTDVSDFTVTTSTTGNTVIHSFTQTGDLDGAGIADDTLSFDLVTNAFTDSTFDGTNVSLGTNQITPAIGRNFHNNLFTTGDTLSLEAVSYTHLTLPTILLV